MKATQKFKLDKKLIFFFTMLDHEDFRVYINNIYQTNKLGMIIFSRVL